MKKPWLAFVLSLFIPGAGLAYLGKWLFAVLNFALVQAVLLGIVVTEPDRIIIEHIHYVVLGFAGASAGAAHAVALRVNAKRQLEHQDQMRAGRS